MKRLLVTLLVALTVGAAAQFPGLKVEAHGFKQEGETVRVSGRVQNDGTFTAKKVALEAIGLQGEGDGAQPVVTQEWPVGDIAGGEFQKFDFKFTCNVTLTNVLVRVKSARFR